MTDHRTHEAHDHDHAPGCGHTAVSHTGHTDYLHEGHLHGDHDGHVDEHTLDASTNPDECTPDHACARHDDGHEHGTECGHEAVPHADHTDYFVDDHLHHAHGDHCDTHGALQTV